MNSLYENMNSLESREQILERLGDAICQECGYLAIHSRYPLCSKYVGQITPRLRRVALTFQGICDSLTTQKIKYRINPSEPLSLANNPLKGEPSK